jgi:hypothetical protein
MAQQTYQTGSVVRIVIPRCHGDLTVVGEEDRQDVVMRSDRSYNDQTAFNEGELVINGGHGDIHLRVPSGATVVGERIAGDAEVSNVAQAEFRSVGGDFSAKDLTGLQVENVGGDFDATLRGGFAGVGRVGGDVEVRGASSLQLGTVGGDAEIADVDDLLGLGVIGADLSLRWTGRLNVPIEATVGGDAEIALDDSASFTLNATVGGDVSGEGRRPTRTNGNGEADASDHGGRWDLEAGGGQLMVIYGDGTTAFNLRVGGDLNLRGGNVTNATFEGNGRSDFFEGDFAGIGDEMRRFGREMKNMGRQIAREVAREVRASTRSAGPGPRPRVQVQFNDKSFQFDADQIDRLTREAREAAASGVARAQEAVERALVNMVSQRDRARGPVPPRPPQAPGAPVPPRPATGQTVRIERAEPADTRSPEEVQEEKLAILRMVSEGRLAIDEAEAMLRALEGRGS